MERFNNLTMTMISLFKFLGVSGGRCGLFYADILEQIQSLDIVK